MEQPLKPQAKPNSLRFLTESQRDYVAAMVDLERKVHNARRCGASWAEIGTILGTSKQAVQQRYGKGPSKELIAADHAEDAPIIASKSVDAPAPAVEFIEPKTPKTQSKKVDAPAPATATASPVTSIIMGPPHVESWTDPRPAFKLKSAGMIDGVAQPGTGKGPHQCPRCGSTNHKSGRPDTIAAYFDCKPTKYDPQDITDHLNTTGLSK